MDILVINGARASSNVYVIIDDKIAVIDSGNGKNFGKIESKFDSAGVDINDVDILINTHHHFDHIGGNENFVNKSSCDLMASETSTKFIEEGNNDITLANRFGTDLNSLKVSRVLEDEDKIDFGGSHLKVITTPGHTSGDICLFEPKNQLLFSGDTVFKRGIGRLDLPTAEPDSMPKSIKKLTNLDVKKIYPGHGNIINEEGNKYIKRALKMAKNH